MWPDRVSNPGPLTYESGALPIALRGLARQKSGMIQFMGPANITCGHDYAILGQITADY